MEWNRLREKISNWELWPFSLRYAAISPMWLWYCAKAGSPWFFSASNPTITFGGFEGEPKKEMYELLPSDFYPKTIYINPAHSFDEVKKAAAEAGFTYPFCVKPDIGMKGLLFRKIDNEQQLKTYHQTVPIDYIIQELVLYPMEVSVFYCRYPNQQKGFITGFIQKELMEVTGDGHSRLIDLIRQHPKAKHREDEMQVKHAEKLDVILPEGERFYLTYAANLNRGARFINLHQQIDDKLLSVFDKLSHRAQFYYGRYDIKCQSVEDLKEEKNFSILEFNGSGAEPNHVYNCGYSLKRAQKEFLHHWQILYRISVYNHQQGILYWPYKKGLNFLKKARKHLELLEEYDAKILF